MGSGASKKKPESKIQKKLSAAVAFTDAGDRAKVRREQEEQNSCKHTENGNVPATTQQSDETFITQEQKNDKNSSGPQTEACEPPQRDEKKDAGKQNGAIVGADDNKKPEMLDKVTKIQSVFRGYQDRKALQKENEMAIKIQRRFRRHRSSVLSESDISNTTSPTPKEESTGSKTLSKEEQLRTTERIDSGLHYRRRVLAERKEQRRFRARAWRDGGPDPEKKEFTMEIGQKTREEFSHFRDEIIELQWYAEQQLEITSCGRDFAPPRIMLISSNVPKSDLLVKAVRSDKVLIFNYDFATDTFDSILDAIKVNLQGHRPGCKAQSLCIYALGGPGYLYILKKKVLTTAKLKKDTEADQVRFWQEIGKLMSRVNPQDTVIHVMGCNILGKESGLQLFDDLEDIIKPNIVRFESPLELSPEGYHMINCYFDREAYNFWKSTRYVKADSIVA